MAVFPHGSVRGGSRSDGPQQIKDLRADDFYGDSHDGNDGSRGSHDTTRNTRTYTLPTFAEATDASEAMRERRADRNKSIALRVLAAVLIFSAIGIGLFPENAAIPVRAKAGEHVRPFRAERRGLAVSAGRRGIRRSWGVQQASRRIGTAGDWRG